MKTKIAFLMLTMLTLRGVAQEKMNKVSVNPLQLFVFNIGNVEYERGFRGGKLGVSFYYGRTGNTTRTFRGLRTFVTEQQVSIKHYPGTIAASGLWYGGQVSVASGNVYSPDVYNDRAYDIGTLGLTGKFGYQYIHKSFYLDFFGGVGYALTNNLFGKATYLGGVSEAKILFTYGIKTGIVF